MIRRGDHINTAPDQGGVSTVTTDPGQYAGRSLLTGMGLVALAGALLASQDAAIKDMTDRLSPVQISFIRYAWHAVFVALGLWLLGYRRIYRTRLPQLHLARALALVTASTAMFVALSRIPLGSATVIQFLSPLVVTLLSVLVLGERIGVRRIVALCLGFLGVLVVIGPQVLGGGQTAGHAGLYWGLPLVSACAAAVYVLLTRHLSQQPAGRAEQRPGLALMPVLCLGALAPAQPFLWRGLTFGDLATLAVLGAVGAVAHGALQLGMQAAPASVLSPFLYSQVICASLLGIVFFDDPMGWSFVLGTVLIIGAGLAIWWIERPKQLLLST